jgi:hypothetical protein
MNYLQKLFFFENMEWLLLGAGKIYSSLTKLNYNPVRVYFTVNELSKTHNLKILLTFVSTEKDGIDMFCQTSNNAKEICDDDNTWKLKVEMLYPDQVIFKPLNKTWKSFFLQIDN